MKKTAASADASTTIIAADRVIVTDDLIRCSAVSLHPRSDSLCDRHQIFDGGSATLTLFTLDPLAATRSVARGRL